MKVLFHRILIKKRRQWLQKQERSFALTLDLFGTSVATFLSELKTFPGQGDILLISFLYSN